jgi:threonine/homoserine/homoserine lactone efflux protein
VVPFENLLPFIAATVVVVVVPGPSVLFTVGRTLALGRRGGILSIIGNALGTVPLIIAVALGVGALVAKSIVLFTAMKFIGALYLVYLGIQAIRHRKDSSTPETRRAAQQKTPLKLMSEGFIVGVTNPKTLAFFMAILPQFVSVHAGSVPLQLLTLGGMSLIIGVVSDTSWSLVSNMARTWFSRSTRSMSLMSATGGMFMICLGILLAFTGSQRAPDLSASASLPKLTWDL